MPLLYTSRIGQIDYHDDERRSLQRLSPQRPCQILFAPNLGHTLVSSNHIVQSPEPNTVDNGDHILSQLPTPHQCI